MSGLARATRALTLPAALAADPLPAPWPLPAALLAALQGGHAAARAELAAGRARLVMTGQQPCFPLPLGLSLQKAATAIALAAQLRAAGAGPVYACFWSAADDSDFAEARGQLLARPGRPPLAVGLSAAQERPGGFVGDLELAAPWAELAGLAGLAGRFADFAPRAAEDLGAHTARLMVERFAPWGLFVLDAREEALRRAAAPLYARYAERRTDFAAAVDAAGAALAPAGGAPPLRSGIGERALFFLRSRRRLLPSGMDYGNALARRLAEAPASLAPNAALRPLVQDAVFPVAASVLGPAEWEYHRQLQAGFRILDLPFPPALPRLRARSGRDLVAGLDGEGRRSSPLAVPGHPLADPAGLVALAEEHLAAWAAGEHIEWTLEPTPEGA
jgi:hypothetical protein